MEAQTAVHTSGLPICAYRRVFGDTLRGVTDGAVHLSLYILTRKNIANMKKILFLLISIFLANYAYSQNTLKSLTKDCFISFSPENRLEEFKFRDEYGEWVECSTANMAALLRKDVIVYYGLEDKYDTPLKISAYKKTDDYQDMIERIGEEYNVMTQSKSYMLYSLAHNNPYDMAKHCFNFKIIFDNIAKCSTPNYFSFGGGLALTFPSAYMTYKKVATNENSYGFWQYNILRTPVISEETALKIEENLNNSSILIIFKIQKSNIENKPILGVSGYTMEVPFVLGKTIGVYIVNTATGEVYADISNILTQTTPNKKPTTQRRR